VSSSQAGPVRPDVGTVSTWRAGPGRRICVLPKLALCQRNQPADPSTAYPPDLQKQVSENCAVFLRMALPFREQSNRLSRGSRAGLTAWLPQLGRFITEGDALPTVEISTVAIKSLTAFPREESDLARAVHTTTASSAHWHAVLAKRGRSLLSTLPSAASGPCNCCVLCLHGQRHGGQQQPPRVQSPEVGLTAV